jgi:hypothetical protein
MKILSFFLFPCVILALLDPDSQLECGSGSGYRNSNFLVLKAKATCLILVWDDGFCPALMRYFLALKAKTTCLILVWDEGFCPALMRLFLVLKAKTAYLILVWDDGFCPALMR